MPCWTTYMAKASVMLISPFANSKVGSDQISITDEVSASSPFELPLILTPSITQPSAGIYGFAGTQAEFMSVYLASPANQVSKVLVPVSTPETLTSIDLYAKDTSARENISDAVSNSTSWAINRNFVSLWRTSPYKFRATVFVCKNEATAISTIKNAVGAWIDRNIEAADEIIQCLFEVVGGGEIWKWVAFTSSQYPRDLVDMLALSENDRIALGREIFDFLSRFLDGAKYILSVKTHYSPINTATQTYRKNLHVLSEATSNTNAYVCQPPRYASGEFKSIFELEETTNTSFSPPYVRASGVLRGCVEYEMDWGEAPNESSSSDQSSEDLSTLNVSQSSLSSSSSVAPPNDALKAFDIDLSSGTVYSLKQNGDGGFVIVRSDEMTGEYIDETEVAGISEASDLVLEQNPTESCLPFRFYGGGSLSNSTDLDTSLPFSFFSDTRTDFQDVFIPLSNLPFSESSPSSTLSFQMNAIHNQNGDTGSPEAYVPVNNNVYKNVVNALIWGAPAFGVKKIKVGAVSASAFEDFFEPTTSLRLPRFSWKTIATIQTEAVLIGYEDGTSGLYTDVEGSQIATLTGSLPIGSLPITDIATNGKTAFFGNGISGFAEVGIEDLNVIGSKQSSGETVMLISPQGEMWGGNKDKTSVFTGSTTEPYELSEIGLYDKVVAIRWNGTLNCPIVFSESKAYSVIEDQITQFYYSPAYKTFSAQVSSKSQMIFMASGSSGHRITVLNPDLFSIKHHYTYGKPIRYLETIDGTPLALIEESISSGYKYTLFDFESGSQYNGESISVDSKTVMASRRTATDNIILVCSNGTIKEWNINDGTIIQLANTAKPTSTASDIIAYQKDGSGSNQQNKIRVYVGSRIWSSDRWDSGEIDTQLNAILYGGGDNLVPGQKYWVHIMINTSKGWSSPQVQSFVLPKE